MACPPVPATVRTMHPLRSFARNSAWVHTTVGLVGNLAFVVGSVLFLWDSTLTAGIWCFIVGSAFMLVGSAGDALVKLEGPGLDTTDPDD